MKLHAVRIALALAMAAGVAAINLSAQTAPAERDFDEEIRTSLQSAKRAAGFEFLGTLVRVCLLPQSGGVNTTDNPPRYIRDPASMPAREAWYADSAKVFDNLYFVGGKIHSSWALTTTEGIIIIDTIYPYNSEELIVGGLQRLGLDPEAIRYVIIAHAHGDHIGGSEMLQTRYGAQVVMGEADWELVETYPNRYTNMAPKRDIVATDGMKITLGDTTVTLWETPGHTPGTLSFTFTVRDKRQAGQRGVFGRHRVQFREQHAGPGHSELRQLHRVAAAHRRAGRGHGRDGPPLESFRVRQRRQQEPHACQPG